MIPFNADVEDTCRQRIAESVHLPAGTKSQTPQPITKEAV